MAYPSVSRGMKAAIASGKYGPELKQAIDGCELPAVCPEDLVYLCYACGSWDVFRNASVYEPADPEAVRKEGFGIKAVEEWGGAPEEPMCQGAFCRRLNGKSGTRGGGSTANLSASIARSTGCATATSPSSPAQASTRAMMQLAGHDTVRVCMEIYTHVSDDMQREAAKKAPG